MHNQLQAPARPSSPPVYMMRCPSSENLLEYGKPPAYFTTIPSMPEQGENTHSTSHLHLHTPRIVVQPPSPMLTTTFEGMTSAPSVSLSSSGFDPAASEQWDCGDDEDWVPPNSEASMPDPLSTEPPLVARDSEGRWHSNSVEGVEGTSRKAEVEDVISTCWARG
ncbi:hypothetical protein CYLTODRAFT_455158 [Cylindrobasidium torrendii FP15055 ss-10]|uniref:Uncharacterized protein n=1 Tax=Cylindrobasidium torrendii FP15055 ss-10 TaxID=1314674 RepID=A0A0D7B862_9AGAR|nr:hypothetical protein CYLTODRAFT_455158 [Cylindrobasidium torrendii FP15055 ss-10]